MKRVFLVLVLSLFLLGCTSNPLSQGGFGEIYCDAKNPCPKGMECWQFEDALPQCFKESPCDMFCHGDCLVLESYPPQVSCNDPDWRMYEEKMECIEKGGEFAREIVFSDKEECTEEMKMECARHLVSSDDTIGNCCIQRPMCIPKSLF